MIGNVKDLGMRKKKVEISPVSTKIIDLLILYFDFRFSFAFIISLQKSVIITNSGLRIIKYGIIN